MKKLNYIAFILVLNLANISCKNTVDTGEDKQNTITPVEVSNPKIDTIAEYIELNATSSFLKKDYIKSNTNGYIVGMNISIGDHVKKGQLLFIIQTKESRALGNFKSSIDTSLHFNGDINVISPKAGVVSALSHQKGDYVQDGEQLAIISEQNSLVFLVDAPFEYHKYLISGTDCNILLPDGEKLQANISSSLPAMDAATQTENFIVQPVNAGKLPEGLIAKVQLVKQKKQHALVIAKVAVLTDEKQEEYWVMKMLDDSTAVKIPIKKGIENPGRVEVLSPQFNVSDRLITSGNYGLTDTAKVKIVK